MVSVALNHFHLSGFLLLFFSLQSKLVCSSVIPLSTHPVFWGGFLLSESAWLHPDQGQASQSCSMGGLFQLLIWVGLFCCCCFFLFRTSVLCKQHWLFSFTEKVVSFVFVLVVQVRRISISGLFILLQGYSSVVQCLFHSDKYLLKKLWIFWKTFNNSCLFYSSQVYWRPYIDWRLK